MIKSSLLVKNKSGDFFMSSYFKRAVIGFVAMLTLMMLCGIRVATVATDEKLMTAGTNQSKRKVVISERRGLILDCNGALLTDSEFIDVTLVFPNDQGAMVLQELLFGNELKTALNKLKSGNTVLVNKKYEKDSEGAVSIEIPKRYSGSLTHIIGYVNSEGHGVSGIEKGLDSVLFCDNSISISYEMDSTGRMLQGAGYSIDYGQTDSFVKLTVDKEIQNILESAMFNVSKGAAVIVDAKSGKIKAMVSRPDYDPDNLADALNDENAPFINRALYSYNVGSVFKPCIAAAAIENGKQNYQFNCTGVFSFSGLDFKCHKRQGHSTLGLKSAISESCNTYFYSLGLELGGEAVYKAAQNFRFSQPLDLGGGIISSAGSMPNLSTLKTSPAALINLSIGQGDLMLSPVAISLMYCAIANGGKYYMPSIIEGVSQNGVYTPYESLPPTLAIEKETANTLKEYLKSTLLEGTGSAAYNEGISAGGKTGTAQTGWIEDGRNILNGWFCGFYEGVNTDYAIVILKEDVRSGSYDCAPVFKEITMKMFNAGY